MDNRPLHPAGRRSTTPLRLLRVLIMMCLMNATGYAQSAKTRIILDTDANNELDDQHAIAYMLFSGNAFDVEGITINRTRNGGALGEHVKEADRVVRLCGLEQRVAIHPGASGTFDQIKDQVAQPGFDGSDAVEFIIARAHAVSDRKLVLLPVGKLTNIALALHKDPTIAAHVRIVWLGSNYPAPGEYNQDNDVPSLNYILGTEVDFEIALVRYGSPSGTDAVRASLTEIRHRMPGLGPGISRPVVGRHGDEFHCFGDYSVDLFENMGSASRALFDMAAVAIVKNPSWAQATRIPAPKVVEGQWVERLQNPRSITLWQNFNREKIMQDFYTTMENYVLVTTD